MTKRGKRIEYIDIARALGMVAIIIGHTGFEVWPVAVRICFSFHLPLFFIISGLLSRKYPWKELLRKRFKSLIIPYLITSAIIITLVFLMRHSGLTFWNGPTRTTWSWVLSALYGSGFNIEYGVQPIGAIWFLLALFFASLFLNLIIDKKYRFVYAGISLLAAYMIAPHFWAPWSILSACAAAFFMLVGVKIKEIGLDRIMKWPIVLASFLVWLGIMFLSFGAPDYFSMVRLSFVNLPLDLIAAITGTICILAMSKLIEKYAKPVGDFIKPFGEYSLIVMCAHLVDLTFIDWYAILNLLHFPVESHYVLRIVGQIIWCICWVAIIRFAKFYRKHRLVAARKTAPAVE